MSLSAGDMHYVDEGTGPPVLLVHGTPTWSFEYRHVIAALSKRYRCVAPDHFGFGLSERAPGFAYTPEAHAEALREFVDQLGLDAFTLVVHDFGGPIGLPLAVRASSPVRKLVILNTFAWPIDDDRAMAGPAKLIGGAVGRFLYRYANASQRLIMPSAYGDRKLLTKAIHRQYLEVFRDREARVQVLHTLARALLGSRAHYQSLLDALPRLRVPTLVLWGMKDTAFKPYHLARWQALLPHASVVRLEHSGHWPHEEEPSRVVAEIERFLN
ncbi:MAG: alpha/beta fold hydrolase [Vicinamibacterales bacterium]